jgi:uncharacterized membrane protein
MEDRPQPPLGPMLLSMAAAVAVLMAVTGAERRVYPDGPPEMVHWGLLAFGVLASTAVYTFVMRALTKKR